MKEIIFIIIILLIPLGLAESPRQTCEKIFYFILEKGTFPTLNESNLNISEIEFKNYLENYTTLCYLSNLSDPLPLKSTPKLTISNPSQEDCKTDIGNEFFDWTFPPKIVNFKVSTGTECKNLNTQKFFISYEKVGENVYFRGIRFYLLFFPVLFYFIYKFIKEGRMLRKLK